MFVVIVVVGSDEVAGSFYERILVSLMKVHRALPCPSLDREMLSIFVREAI